MSRLDSFIRRLEAQRASLNFAGTLIGAIPGPILELGLGNGRTYDHLRHVFPDREIFVFDRHIAAHPECIPTDNYMILGDIRETLPSARSRIGALAVLAHVDIGSGDEHANAEIASFIGDTLPNLMAPVAFIVSDLDLSAMGWTSQRLPRRVRTGRYFMYRRG